MLQCFMDTIFSEYEWCLPLFFCFYVEQRLSCDWFSHRNQTRTELTEWLVKKFVAHVYTFTIMCKMQVLFSWMFQSKDEYFCRIVVSLCIIYIYNFDDTTSFSKVVWLWNLHYKKNCIKLHKWTYYNVKTQKK